MAMAFSLCGSLKIESIVCCRRPKRRSRRDAVPQINAPASPESLPEPSSSSATSTPSSDASYPSSNSATDDVVTLNKPTRRHAYINVGPWRPRAVSAPSPKSSTSPSTLVDLRQANPVSDASKGLDHWADFSQRDGIVLILAPSGLAAVTIQCGDHAPRFFRKRTIAVPTNLSELTSGVALELIASLVARTTPKQPIASVDLSIPNLGQYSWVCQAVYHNGIVTNYLLRVFPRILTISEIAKYIQCIPASH